VARCCGRGGASACGVALWSDGGITAHGNGIPDADEITANVDRFFFTCD
jgi:hypothetical protein